MSAGLISLDFRVRKAVARWCDVIAKEPPETLSHAQRVALARNMVEGIAPPLGGASPLPHVIFLVATFLDKPEEEATDAEVDLLLEVIFADFVALGAFQG